MGLVLTQTPLAFYTLCSQAHANPRAKDRCGFTCLHAAAAAGSMDTARVLLEK